VNLYTVEMSTLQHLPVVLSPGEDGWILATCPVIPGCTTQGRTRDEALANIREAIELCLGPRIVHPADPSRRLQWLLVRQTLTQAVEGSVSTEPAEEARQARRPAPTRWSLAHRERRCAQ
jgi:predicted RNase H-like HicB family nuclease